MSGTTTAIQEFLKCYTDEQLAALRAHCEDGKLVYRSCCCLTGAKTATHALRGSYEDQWNGGIGYDYSHYTEASRLSGAIEAEREFEALGGNDSDEERRQIVLPLILAEQQRREGCLEVIAVTAEVNA